MRKRIKRLFGKKGLTLVEVLVVLVVSSILLGIAMGMLRPVSSLLNTLKGNAHLDAVCDTANEYMRGRLQTALSVTMLKADDPEKVKKAAEDCISAAGSNVKLRAIGVLDADKSTAELYRIYDFGTIGDSGISVDQLKGYITDPSTAYNDYAAFRNEFYEGTSYSVSFGWGEEKEMEGGTKADGTPDTIKVTDWLKVTSACEKNGERSNQERSLYFRIFGGSVQFESGEAVVKNGSGAMVILYTVRDVQEIIEALPPST